MKIMKFTLLLLFCLILSACTQSDAPPSLDEIKDKDWDSIKEEADGSEVRLYMWGGDEGINEYIDEWLIPRLKEKYNLTLERVPMDTEEILQKLQTEQQAGKNTGTIDIIWLNGENFKMPRRMNCLLDLLPENCPASMNITMRQTPRLPPISERR
ncbi:hypothetical protein [Halobacillus sp. A5]|uniref:hypothetical protein n=1 Tax=Halobacillus sp. A5 TaxID=2880263 RepID=UPI0020A6B004|nr:hypothetical protein [Halobacillus sp. A5]MCP3029268.1 hypothetical protein [Halobacillus sp. A5]